MSEEILVNFTPMETRVALLDSGVLQEIHIERSAKRSIVGNIYVGKVVRVLPGMQAAFVDIGLERTGFIAASDIVALGSRDRADVGRPADLITDQLHDGKKIVVQVTREPLGTKGARLTTDLSLATRYLVLMPHTDHIGVSQLIQDSLERTRLQQVLAQALDVESMRDAGGYILRTAAEGADPDDIATDVRFLKRLWAAVSRSAKAATKAELLYGDLPLHLRTLRDLARPSVTRIVIDNQECFATLQAFCGEYVPELAGLLEYYSGTRPLLELHGVEDEIQHALERRVALASGGYLVIDQTEAMTTVDVNSGSFVGKGNHAETILQINLEAATALARQLRLRNLGGIIIVDFIDMDSAAHRGQVHHILEKLLQRDPARIQITGISTLGLVEITRKRTRDSLAHVLCEDCPVCQGRGVVRTTQTVCYDIFRQLLRAVGTGSGAALLVLAAPAVVERLRDEESAHLARLEEFVGTKIAVRAQTSYSQEHFDIILL